MTQYHATHTIVTDNAADAERYGVHIATVLAGVLEQPGVTHLGTSITAVGEGIEEPNTRDRIEALIAYLGEDQALQALQNDASIYDYDIHAVDEVRADDDTTDLHAHHVALDAHCRQCEALSHINAHLVPENPNPNSESEK